MCIDGDPYLDLKNHSIVPEKREKSNFDIFLVLYENILLFDVVLNDLRRKTFDVDTQVLKYFVSEISLIDRSSISRSPIQTCFPVLHALYRAYFFKNRSFISNVDGI